MSLTSVPSGTWTVGITLTQQPGGRWLVETKLNDPNTVALASDRALSFTMNLTLGEIPHEHIAKAVSELRSYLDRLGVRCNTPALFVRYDRLYEGDRDDLIHLAKHLGWEFLTQSKD